MVYCICSMSVVFYAEWWQSSKWNKTNNLPGKNGPGRILCTDLAHLAYTPTFSVLFCPTTKMLDLGVKMHYAQIPFNFLQKKKKPNQSLTKSMNMNRLASFIHKLIPYWQNWTGSPSECFYVKWEAFLKRDPEKFARYFIHQ